MAPESAGVSARVSHGAVMHESMLDPRLVRATNIVGETVKSCQGEDLGQVRDLLIDLDTGQIAYAVLSFGGFLGLGKKLFAVPWTAFSLCDEELCVNIDRERLEHAPAFDKDQWPDVSDRRWGNELHSYYNLRPYWEAPDSSDS